VFEDTAQNLIGDSARRRGRAQRAPTLAGGSCPRSQSAAGIARLPGG
jgi:hypothetical protein